MIIFTHDPSPFMDPPVVVMHEKMTTLPVQPNITYILHSNNFGSRDVERWSDYIRHRLVIVTDKKPELTKKTKELCVVDVHLKGKTKDNYFLAINGTLTWSDRKRVHQLIKQVPIPLAIAFLKANNVDIDVMRKLTQTYKVLPEEYSHAVMAYHIRPKRQKVVWPKKKKEVPTKPDYFRSTDKHWEIIVANSNSVANDLRLRGDGLPKGVKKRKQQVNEWV